MSPFKLLSWMEPSPVRRFTRPSRGMWISISTRGLRTEWTHRMQTLCGRRTSSSTESALWRSVTFTPPSPIFNLAVVTRASIVCSSQVSTWMLASDVSTRKAAFPVIGKVLDHCSAWARDANVTHKPKIIGAISLIVTLHNRLSIKPLVQTVIRKLGEHGSSI